MSFFSIGSASGPVWFDGKWVPWSDATLHVLSHGLNNATCVFEGERVYAGKVFKVAEHTERLLESARILGIPMPYSRDEIVHATEAAVAAQGLRSGYVRPLVWRGHEDLGIDAPNARTHVAIAALACEDIFPLEVKRRGVQLQISEWVRPAPNMAPVRAKASCHYVVGHLAIRAARAAGFDDALLLDPRGYVAESTGSNFFLVKDGTLRTPIPDCALDGITRRTLIELASKLGLPVEEGRISPHEIPSAQEAFLTGTACEVLPIRRIGSTIFPESRPVTERLAQAYFQLVGKE